jgi:hypothetical protein
MTYHLPGGPARSAVCIVRLGPCCLAADGEGTDTGNGGVGGTGVNILIGADE